MGYVPSSNIEYGNKVTVSCLFIALFNIMSDLSFQIWQYVSNAHRILLPYSILWLIYVFNYSNISAIYCKFIALFDIMDCLPSNIKYGEAITLILDVVNLNLWASLTMSYRICPSKSSTK